MICILDFFVISKLKKKKNVSFELCIGSHDWNCHEKNISTSISWALKTLFETCCSYDIDIVLETNYKLNLGIMNLISLAYGHLHTWSWISYTFGLSYSMSYPFINPNSTPLPLNPCHSLKPILICWVRSLIDSLLCAKSWEYWERHMFVLIYC